MLVVLVGRERLGLKPFWFTVILITVFWWRYVVVEEMMLGVAMGGRAASSRGGHGRLG
jgi:hypothetical protein